MTPEEETAFLAPWAEQAQQAGMLIVPPLHQALEKHLGSKVHPSPCDVSASLARHLHPVLGQRTAGALHRRHRHAHRSRDVGVLHPSPLVVLIRAQQDLRSLPFAHRGLAGHDFLQFLAFCFA